MEIPVIDFALFGLNSEIEDINLKSDDLQKLASEIVLTSSTVGFVYLKNHGIGGNEVSQFVTLTLTFKSIYDLHILHKMNMYTRIYLRE